MTQLTLITPKPQGERRTRRQDRAAWWFARMREIVDRAPDRRPAKNVNSRNCYPEIRIT
jgi:hypothetical protein